MAQNSKNHFSDSINSYKTLQNKSFKRKMPRKAISRVRSNPIVKKPVNYTVDLTQPVEDEVIDISDFTDFLKQNLKVDGKKGNLSAVDIAHNDLQVSE